MGRTKKWGKLKKKKKTGSHRSKGEVDYPQRRKKFHVTIHTVEVRELPTWCPGQSIPVLEPYYELQLLRGEMGIPNGKGGSKVLPLTREIQG